MVSEPVLDTLRDAIDSHGPQWAADDVVLERASVTYPLAVAVLPVRSSHELGASLGLPEEVLAR